MNPAEETAQNILTPVDDPATLDELHSEKTQMLAQASQMDDLFRAIDEVQGTREVEVPVEGAAREEEEKRGRNKGPTNVERGTPGMAARAATDVAHGVVEAPSQILGGVIDAVNEVSDMAQEAGEWLNRNVADLGTIAFTDEGIQFLSQEEIDAGGGIENAAQLPTTPEADSTTGGVVRVIAQFAAPFAKLGKLKLFTKMREAGVAGRITSDAIRGALTDFAVFDPHEQRLSDLIQSVPELQNPVTEFLQADEDDPKLVGRLKQALEGIVPGVLIDTVAEGLGRGIKTLKSARKAKAAIEQLDEVQVMRETAEAQRGTIKGLLGDPDAPAFQIKQLDVSPEDLAKGAKEAAPEGQDIFVNWSRIDSPDDVKGIIQEMANLGQEGVDKARRGVVGWQQTKLDAEQLDAWSILAERRKGQPLNNAQTVAVRELWARSGAKLAELTDAVVADPSDINKIAFRKMLAVHNAVQEQVIAARTETARALNAWKIPAGDNVAFAGQVDQLRSLLDTDTTTEQIATRLKLLKDAGMTKEADAFVYGSSWAKTGDAVAQLWYFSLLSGPKTHMRNAISNVAVTLNEMLERKAANIIGKVMGTHNVPDGEMAAQMFGLIQGVRDAFKISAKGRQLIGQSLKQRTTQPIQEGAEEFGTVYRAMATNQSGIGIGKVELPRIGAFSSEKLGLDKTSNAGRVMDFIDTVTTMPGRMLGAADEAFKSFNYGMELNAQAFRRATQEFHSGQITDIKSRVTELLADPDEAMRMAASTRAQINTFTDTPLNTGPWKAFKAVGEVPVLGKIILPFRRTPYDIAVYTFQRTPLAPLVKQWREAIKRGGADADIAWAKFLVGNSILLTMADLAMNGDITGEGPTHHGQRATERRAGIQGSSVRVQVGENEDGSPQYRYFSYRGLEPMATSLGISANIVDILKNTDWEDDNAEVDELVIAASMAIANQLTSQTYMSGVSEFFNAMSDPQRYGESWWNRLAGAAIPTGVAEIARTSDPYLRAVYDMSDSIKARTPGMSKELPFKRDAWGRKITRESGLGSFYDAVSPIYSKSEKVEPIDLELQRLEAWVGKPGRRMSFDGVTVAMDRYPKEYDRLVTLRGQEVTEDINGAPIRAGNFVSSGENMLTELNMLVTGKHPFFPKDLWEMLTDGPDGGKAQQIRAIIREFGNAAKDHLLLEAPELKAEVDDRKDKQAVKYKFLEGVMP